MPIPDTLARKITADFRAEKKYGGRKKFCDALGLVPIWQQAITWNCFIHAALAADEWYARHHMVTNTLIFRILIINDVEAQLKTFWNVFDRIDEFHNCGHS